MFGLGLLEALLLGAMWIAIPVGLFYVVARVVRSFERRGGAPPPDVSALEARMALLEESNSALARQVEHLTEGQLFTTRMLTERAGVADKTAK